ncbi:hypothetical protein CTP10_R81070 (plasmid) [Cupriavidus sp. P-10]|uniref:hypothetical protein n=1 Tax=unclassified Cupriavidus TaxID=2640874 RepID=UPI0011C12234|nr:MULTISPECIES: hypothetical protein [unclassified Cupriavidus]BDB30690.1 hypothetical protein CTP10_R81070 [Cupriavidus sp. P-10]
MAGTDRFSCFHELAGPPDVVGNGALKEVFLAEHATSTFGERSGCGTEHFELGRIAKVNAVEASTGFD